MESSNPHTLAKRLRHILQVVYYMLRKCISKRKLMMDLHLLFQRGKLAGKALGTLLTTFHHHHHHHHTNPKEVEFSCSNTPYFFPSLAKRRNTRRHHRRANFESFDAADIAMTFQMMNGEDSDADSVATLTVLPTPSPMMVRELRITDSPFPVGENEVMNGGMIDKEADNFIKWFYEQLLKQQLVSEGDTPEYDYRRRRSTGRN